MAKLVEMRTYRLKPGGPAQWMKTYEEQALKLQKEILGHLVGYYQTEIGPLNEVIHMWAYDGLDARAERRAKLASHPDWQKFIPNVRPLVETQESKILIPAPFSPTP
ncbi:MAG TPA: NIPSNAP family protein [Alphaproteobacteria bacterium]